MEERYETFTGLMTRIGRSIRRIKAEEMARYHLKVPHASCLYYLSAAGCATAAELCGRCDEDKAAVSRALEDLVAQGYVVREGEKRYRSALRLTPEGEEICCSIAQRIEEVVARAGVGLEESERAAMYHALSVIGSNLETICERMGEA